MASNTYAEVLSDGSVSGFLTAPEYYVNLKDTGIGAHEIENYWYDFETREFKAKEPLSYTVEVNELTATITGLPEGVNVVVDGLYSAVSTQSPLVIQFDFEGAHRITLSGHVKYLDDETTVEIE